jgi:hypothetical protein
MKSAAQCGSGKSCSPTVLPTRCYASTNRRSRQATYPAVCSKRATLLGNVIARNRKPQCGRNFTRHWMLSGHVRAWGRYHSRIIGSMDGEYGPLGRRHSGKGRAVPERPPVDPSPFLFRCAQPILRRIDHATRRPLSSYSPGHWSGLTGTKCPLQADYRDFLEVQFHHRPQHRPRLNVAEVP